MDDLSLSQNVSKIVKGNIFLSGEYIARQYVQQFYTINSFSPLNNPLDIINSTHCMDEHIETYTS